MAACPDPSLFYTGNATVITFSSGFMARIKSYTPPPVTRVSIDNSDISQTCEEAAPGDTYKYGELLANCFYDAGICPPIDGDTEPITITYKDGRVQSFCGFMTGYTPGSAANNEPIMVDISIQVQADVTYEDCS